MSIQDIIKTRIDSLRQIEADLLAQVYAVQGAIAEYENNLLPAIARGDSLTVQEFAELVGGPGAVGNDPVEVA